MKTISYLFFLVVMLFATDSQAQKKVPRFAKFPIMETGAMVYIPAEPTIEKSFSEDSSEVYVGFVELEDILYGFVVVKLSEDLGATPEDWEQLLMSYMEYLNGGFLGLTKTVPAGYGHTMESHPSARGIIQQGENEKGVQYVTKGWVDNKMLAVMYVAYKKEMNFNIQQLYLNGFRFPEE